MTKTIEMVVKVEVSEPPGVTVDADTLLSLARESVVKVRAVEVGAWNGGGAFAWATVRASVQAFGAVRDNAEGEHSPGATAEGDMLDPFVGHSGGRPC